MLAVSPVRNSIDEKESEMESLSMGGDEFPDFSCGNLLDSIDFDDFVGFNDGDLLPDLDMLAVFSISTGRDEWEMNSTKVEDNSRNENPRAEKSASASPSASEVGSESSLIIQGKESTSASKREESVAVNPSKKEADKGRKSKNPPGPGKRKVKVDWTPELHRRFVQAVEQLGVDKAVPSRILELMGIDCLTRHNIASHLQKYRSHRKHLLAREVEAESWSQRRQMYGGTVVGGAGKRDMNPWLAPTMGYPPMTPMTRFRPLHVWGHPSMDPSVMNMWPKHLAHLPPPPTPPPPTWVPARPPHPPPLPLADPSFWHSHHQRVQAPGTPCFPPHMPSTRFQTPPVPGVPPPAMYKIDPSIGVPTGQPLPQPPFDFHPSMESIDAAIGDALSNPWLPLPLGLKPPSIDSVMAELQHQGISNIPPKCA